MLVRAFDKFPRKRDQEYNCKKGKRVQRVTRVAYVETTIGAR